MERTLGSLVVGIVIVAFVFGGRSCRKSSAGEDYRLEAHSVVTQIEGYNARPEYFDWLVDVCHENAFDSAYVRQGSRRRDRSYVDEEKYYFNLFTAMMLQASGDNAGHVATAIQKFRDDHLRDPERRRPSRPRAVSPR